MAPHLIKVGVGLMALAGGLVPTSAAFAVRNRYTHEQASDLGIAIMQAIDARDARGRPVREPRYPSETYGMAPGDGPAFDGDR